MLTSMKKSKGYKPLLAVLIVLFLIMVLLLSDLLSITFDSAFGLIFFVNEIIPFTILVIFLSFYLIYLRRVSWILLFISTVLYVLVDGKDQIIVLITTIHRDGNIKLLEHPASLSVFMYLFLLASTYLLKPKKSFINSKLEEIIDR